MVEVKQTTYNTTTMMAFISSIKALAKHRTTYRAGLLQAKAYRILKRRTAALLEPEDLNTIEWALLGLLLESPSTSSGELAAQLLVEQPFVTVMTTKLVKRGLIAATKNPNDARSKLYSLTNKGAGLVHKTEEKLRTGMRTLLEGAGPRDIAGYLIVLEAIVRNASASERTPLKPSAHQQ